MGCTVACTISDMLSLLPRVLWGISSGYAIVDDVVLELENEIECNGLLCRIIVSVWFINARLGDRGARRSFAVLLIAQLYVSTKRRYLQKNSESECIFWQLKFKNCVWIINKRFIWMLKLYTVIAPHNTPLTYTGQERSLGSISLSHVLLCSP